MTIPNPRCPHRMQVHHIIQETPDVYTLALICHDFYPYKPGQYALVSIGNTPDTVRAYSLSSTPGVSTFLSLTIRRIENGTGSQWLTREVHIGDELWLSEAQGDFTCADKSAHSWLLVAGGCGVTPVMSMYRWLQAKRPEDDVQVIYCVRSEQDIIFAGEWQTVPVTLVAEQGTQEGILSGRITATLINSVPNIAGRTVMTCGPAPFMTLVESLAREAGATEVHKEAFFIPPIKQPGGGKLTFTTHSPLRNFQAPVGLSLLEVLEQNQVAVNSACRAGVCGCCKTRITKGKYQVSSTATLTEQEIAEGYVLACACQPQSDLELA